MKYYKSGYFIIFFNLISVFSILSAENERIKYFIPENIYRFADYLYKEGDYLKAASEFQRYLLTFDSLPANTDSIFFKIGLCYRLARDFPKAIDYFNRIVESYPQSPYLSKVYYQIALSYSLEGRYKEFTRFIDSNLSLIDQDDIKLKMNQLIGLNYIQQKKWDEAIDFLGSLNISIKRDSITILLANFAKEGQRLPHKSKLLAGLFSTIVPGTGKLYCNRSWDGFFSLLTIGITGYQAYEGFRKDGAYSIKGWVFGSISAVFYLGNIYGSVVAAKIYNEQQEEKLLNKVSMSINAYFH